MAGKALVFKGMPGVASNEGGGWRHEGQQVSHAMHVPLSYSSRSTAASASYIPLPPPLTSVSRD